MKSWCPPPSSRTQSSPKKRGRLRIKRKRPKRRRSSSACTLRSSPSPVNRAFSKVGKARCPQTQSLTSCGRIPCTTQTWTKAPSRASGLTRGWSLPSSRTSTSRTTPWSTWNTRLPPSIDIKSRSSPQWGKTTSNSPCWTQGPIDTQWTSRRTSETGERWAKPTVFIPGSPAISLNSIYYLIRTR